MAGDLADLREDVSEHGTPMRVSHLIEEHGVPLTLDRCIDLYQRKATRSEARKRISGIIHWPRPSESEQYSHYAACRSGPDLRLAELFWAPSEYDIHIIS